MPPKNRGSSKKPTKARTPPLIDGLTKEEMSKEQLEEHIVRLREELDREREERNYFQLERDKIHTFWEVTDRQLQEVKAERKNLDKDLEEDEGRHQLEIKVYKQKMKHLLCEHQNTVSELKADGLVSTQVVLEEQVQLEAELHKDIRATMADMQELNNRILVQETQLKHDELMTQTRNDWEKQVAEIQAKYDKKLEMLPQELDNMRRHVTSEREDNWNGHINTLIEVHNKGFSDAEALFNHKVEDLDKHDLLKKQTEDVTRKQKQKEKDLVCLLQVNQRLAELLSKAGEENTEYEKQMKYSPFKKDSYEKQKIKELDDLKRDCESLERKFNKLQQEKAELQEEFTQSIEQMQQEANIKILQKERKLKGLTDGLETMQAQLSSVLSASNMDHTTLNGMTDRIENNLDSINTSIKNVQGKKVQISQAREDLLLNYEAKQRALGVAVEELCVEPF